VRLSFKAHGAATVLASLYQEGCYKARFPRRDAGASTEVILVNTSGGLTDGDFLASDVAWQTGTVAMCTTQAAERIYRSRDADATIRTVLTIASGATACWLPQETILFDGGRLSRATNVDMAPDSRLIAVESVVFGRTGMGETTRTGKFLDRWRINVDEKPVFADAVILDDTQAGPLNEQMRQRAVANGVHCMATLIYAGDDCDRRVDAIRNALTASDVTAGASNLGPVIVARILAADSQRLRDSIASVFTAAQAADTHPKFVMPRVWHC
jgi:urease accessory protein